MIKTDVKVGKTKPEFPMLMIDPKDGMIILATGIVGCIIKGTVLHLGSYDGQNLSLGMFVDEFSTTYFKPFVGSITLTQE